MSNVRLRIKMGDERVTVAEAARRIGISQMGLWSRLKRGVPREHLLSPGYGPRHLNGLRSKQKLLDVVKDCGSAFGAAMHGELTAEEFLAVTGNDDE